MTSQILAGGFLFCLIKHFINREYLALNWSTADLSSSNLPGCRATHNLAGLHLCLATDILFIGAHLICSLVQSLAGSTQ